MDGVYAPDSITRRLSRERVLLLGGPRALILQVAHPLVAAGVVEHSSFRADPLLRLRRTLEATLAVVFGTSPEAEAAAGQINRIHDAVRGVTPQAAGPYRAGTAYDARDPDLLLWVHATLVDTTLEVYPRYVAPLSAGEEERAYQESKTVARMLRVPEEILPQDLAAFRRYMSGMVVSDQMTAAPFQRELVDDILHPPLRFVPRWAYVPMVAITAALLPPPIRELYDLELTPRRRRAAAWSQRLVRGILPVLPPIVRYMPQART